MRRSTLWVCALLAIATSGCEQIKSQYTKIKDTIAAKIAQRRGRAPAAPAQPAPAPPTPQAPTPTTEPAKPPPHRTPAVQVPQGPVATRDVPYVSNDTGTVAPGMSEKEVYSLWGPPADVRRQGEYTYLFFPNGCEYTCGTADVVILQNGQIVDAILRWPGHRYSGQSSSPAATQPHARPGGDTLTVKPPSSP